MNKKLLKCFIFLFVGLMVFPVFSQIRESGIIHGNVVDDQGNPLHGAKVKISGANLIGGVKTFVTDKKGYYRFPSLPPGKYIVSAELEGFSKFVREGISLHSNMSTTVDFTLTQAKVEEEVLVTGESPTIDIKSSSTGGIVLAAELLTAIPTEKHFTLVMGLAPGVQMEQRMISPWQAEPNAYGMGGFGSNAYQIDGVNVAASDWGDLRYSVDFNAFQEISVQGLGLSAEYGNYVGVILSGITKSGSNKFSTFNEFRFNGSNWNSQNRGTIPAEDFYYPSDKDEKVRSGSYFDIGLQVGGKIIHDKLWFFLSGEYDQTKEYPLGTDVVKKQTLPRGFAKLTYQLNPSNRLNVTVHHEDTVIENALAGPTTLPETDFDYDNPGWIFNVSWTSIFSPTTLLEAKFGYHSFSQADYPKQGRDIAGHYDLSTGELSGNYPFWSDEKNRTLQANAYLNHYAPEFLLGSHDLKIGADVEFYEAIEAGGYNGNELFYDFGGSPYMKQVRLPLEQDYNSNNLTAFIQDTWSVTKRLTFNLGVRFDRYEFNIPTPDKGVIYKDHSFAPRLGLTFDVLGDRKNIIKLFYGHSYSSLLGYKFTGSDERVAKTDYYLWNGTEYAYWYSSEDSSNVEIDPDIKHPYIREISGGFERELFRDASLSINFFYKKLVRTIGTVDIGSKWQKVTITNPGPDGIEGTSDDKGTIDVYDRLSPSSDAKLLFTNPREGQSDAMLDDLRNTSKGFQIIFQKRYSNRWQLLASYQYSEVKGNTGGSIYSSAGSNPNYFVNAEGKCSYGYGQPHEFKLVGNVLLPLDISLGFVAQVISGGSKRESFSVRLPNSYTTVSKAVPAGEAGRYDMQKNLDVRVEKKFKIGKGMLTMMADVFNVLNSDRIIGTYSWYGSKFGKITGIEPPRRFRVSVRFVY